MRTNRCFSGCSVGIALILMSGCGKKAAPTEILRVPVSGAISVDGEPLQEGSIFFVSEDTGGGHDGGNIKDGRYRAEVRPGKKRVEIRSLRIVPGKKGPFNSPYKEESLPACYNTETTLSAEVVATGENEFDYKLASGKDKK